MSLCQHGNFLYEWFCTSTRKWIIRQAKQELCPVQDQLDERIQYAWFQNRVSEVGAKVRNGFGINKRSGATSERQRRNNGATATEDGANMLCKYFSLEMWLGFGGVRGVSGVRRRHESLTNFNVQHAREARWERARSAMRTDGQGLAGDITRLPSCARSALGVSPSRERSDRPLTSRERRTTTPIAA